MTEITPRVDMSDGELELIAAFTEVPIDKVRGIVWLAEWRCRDKQAMAARQYATLREELDSARRERL